jgi:hypothetical protein
MGKPTIVDTPISSAAGICEASQKKSMDAADDRAGDE